MKTWCEYVKAVWQIAIRTKFMFLYRNVSIYEFWMFGYGTSKLHDMNTFSILFITILYYEYPDYKLNESGWSYKGTVKLYGKKLSDADTVSSKMIDWMGTQREVHSVSTFTVIKNWFHIARIFQISLGIYVIIFVDKYLIIFH